MEIMAEATNAQLSATVVPVPNCGSVYGETKARLRMVEDVNQVADREASLDGNENQMEVMLPLDSFDTLDPSANKLQ
jgi:hypothetical protein